MTPSNKTQMKSPKKIAEELVEYLENNPSVCIDGSVTGYGWLRHNRGNWRLVKYGGKDKIRNYVHGKEVTRQEAKEWIQSNPATVKSISDAGNLTESSTTIWEDAVDQDVFTDNVRCFWCGSSEQDTALTTEETIEHGEIHLCSDCKQCWIQAGELAQKR